MKVGFVGMGNMGTTMANIVAGNGGDVLGWDHDISVVREINGRRTNTRYFKGGTLEARVRATGSLDEVIASSDRIFIALPSLYIASSLRGKAEAVRGNAFIVNCAKGIDEKTGETSYQTVSRLFPGIPCLMLSGPSIANELAQKMPTVVCIAGKEPRLLCAAADLLENGYFKVSFSDDIPGVELGGILKNIYAIGLGIFDGCAIGSINFRSVYLTLALNEMAELGMHFGARRHTFFRFSGVGDLFATSMSEHSHNRRLGELLARGRSFAEIRRIMGVVPEGYKTLKAVLKIAKEKGFDAPLARHLYRVVTGRMSTEKFTLSIIREDREHYEGSACG